MKEYLCGKRKAIYTYEGNCTSVHYATLEEYNQYQEKEKRQKKKEDLKKFLSKDIEDLALFSDISDDFSSDSFDGDYEDNSVIEDSPESRDFFEMFGSRKRKKNVVRSRPFRPRICKKEKDLPFATKVVPKPVGLKFDELEVKSVPKRLRMELKRLT